MAVVLPINNFLLLITTLTITLMLPTNVNSATLFNFTTFPKDNPDLTLQGKARISNGVLELTDHLIPFWNTGRALYAEPITIYDSTTGKLVSFQTTFSFVVEEWGINQHADGLAFFLVPDSDPNKIPSDSGTGNLGIINGNTAFNHLVAVEFDSYSNPWDPGFAHIGIDVNSLISLKTVRWNRKSGVLVQVSIVYDSASRSLSVVVTNDGGVLTTLSHSVDLRAVLPEKVVVGLSATTGIAAELHDIHSWSFVVSNFEDESSSSSNMIKNNIATHK